MLKLNLHEDSLKPEEREIERELMHLEDQQRERFAIERSGVYTPRGMQVA